LSKSEEENNDLKATISSMNKEVCKISRTIKVSGQQNERALAFTVRNSAQRYASVIKAVTVELFSLPLPWVLI